ncbi:serine/threonine kinase 17 [Sarotherodon galilaeus]
MRLGNARSSSRVSKRRWPPRGTYCLLRKSVASGTTSFRETGHAKTSWEFFDLMDATLCDTIGTQIVNNKRNKGGSTVSTLPAPLAKIAAKPLQLPQPTSTLIRPSSDFAAVAGGGGGVDSVGLGSSAGTAASTSVTAATISSTNAPDLKPLIVLNETATTSPSLISASNTDLNTLGYTSRKAPSISSGVIPFRLSTTSLTQSQNLLGLSSSFPLMSSCLTSSAATSLSTTTVSGTEGQNQKAKAEQGGSTLFQEILKRQEEQAYLDRVARRRVEAREKRRERREVRMSESLGRIATALELLSSKQDTVIALLQRLADRK